MIWRTLPFVLVFGLALRSFGGGSRSAPADTPFDVEQSKTRMATEPGQLPEVPLTAADAEALWTDLVDENQRRSDRAFWQLAAGGKEAFQVLQKHLRPVARPDPKLLKGLLSDLDSDRFAVRMKASETLATMKNAHAALRAVLDTNPTLEMRRRLELILQKLYEIPEDPDLPQQLLVIRLLEQKGTPEARQFLQAVADGAPGAALTLHAQRALERLENGGESN